MSVTGKIGLPELVVAQAVPETTVNEQVRGLEAYASFCALEDRDLTDPPGTCADSACYLVKATATGAWTGNAGKIAVASGTNASNGWEFYGVFEGLHAWVKDENALLYYDGAAWVASAAAVTFATASEVRGGTEAAKAIAPDQLVASAAPQTLTDGATVNWNMASGYNAKVTIAGNRTLAVSNPVVGLTYCLGVIQDGTGSRTMTWPSSFDWGTTGAPTLTTTASKRDRITVFCTDAATPKFDAFLSGKGFS